MKILIIAPELYPVPHRKGTSVETCIYQIARQWAKQHSVTIVCRKSAKLPAITSQRNLTIRRVSGRTKKTYLLNVIRTVKNGRYDCIQIDNRPEFIPHIKKAFPRQPVSLFLHSLTYVTPPKTTRSRVNKQLFAADVIIANSRSLRSQLSMRYPSHKRKIKVVHLGANPAQFRPPTAAERIYARNLFKAKGTFAVVYIGRIKPSKGIALLIRAAEQAKKSVPALRLYLIGDGKNNYVRRIKRLARRSKVPVTFIEGISVNHIHRAYWMADCIVYPSQSHEAFGLVIAEALASGVPAIASKNGGMREIIRHNQNGLLISNYHRPNSFARAFIQIARNPLLAKKLGKNGRKTCLRTFHWGNTSAKLIKIYQKLQSNH